MLPVSGVGATQNGLAVPVVPWEMLSLDASCLRGSRSEWTGCPSCPMGSSHCFFDLDRCPEMPNYFLAEARELEGCDGPLLLI